MKSIKFCLSVLALGLGMMVCPVANGGATIVDYTTVGAIDQPVLVLGGTTVTGSANIVSGPAVGVGSSGIGIKGGTFLPLGNGSLDLGESMTIDYGQPVTNVTLTVYDIDPAGNVTYQFEAFNGVASIGTFGIPSHAILRETKNLTALAGNAPFSKITLSSTVSAPAGLVIEMTSFDNVPEPSSIALAILAASGSAILPCRRRRA